MKTISSLPHQQQSAPTLIMRKTCACGKPMGPDGECAECKRKRLGLQTKLRINTPGDRYEQEADRVAAAVLQMPASAGSVPAISPLSSPGVQREAVSAETATTIGHIHNSGGQPLPDTTRRFFEDRFDRDFSSVRIHADDHAAASSRQIDAAAFTVGNHIAFGRGQFAPHTAVGQRLLAHELTHVVQQGASGTSSTIQRQSADDEEYLKPPSKDDSDAMMAEMACNIGKLCSLRRNKPEVMTQERLERATKSCMPNYFGLNPCLLPQYAIDPLPQGAVTPPKQSPGVQPGAKPGPAPAPSTGSLTDMLKFKFSAGPVNFNVDLPKSLNISLPIPISSAYALEIATSGKVSGAFSLSVKLDNKPHFSLSLTAGVDVKKETASAGLIVTTKRTVCRATPKESVKTEMETAGKKIEKAVTELQTKSGELKGMERTEKLTDIASGIGDLYSAIQKAEEACKQVPVLEFGFKGETFYGERATDPLERSKQPGTFIGPSLKFYIPGT